MKCQRFKSSNEADNLDQLCKLSVQSMRRSLVRRRRRRVISMFTLAQSKDNLNVFRFHRG
jgi:hypothetical protein